MSEYSEAFEEWAIGRAYTVRRDNKSRYLSPATHCAWLAWQAGGAATQARISELEEAGKKLVDTHTRIVDINAGLSHRISELEAIIESAPHELECSKDWRIGSEFVCDCWKSEIGSK
jgi:hypothetical protein